MNEIKKEMIFHEFCPEDVNVIGLYKDVYVKTFDGLYFIGSFIQNHMGTIFFNSGHYNYSLKQITHWALLPTV